MKYDVLLVEDEENIRSLYTDAISMAGVTVQSAADGKEGLEMALKDHPKLILMDINMPVLAGHAAVAELRRDEWGQHAKVIYLTNNTGDSDVKLAEKLGSDDYVVKALTDVSELVAKIKAILAES